MAKYVDYSAPQKQWEDFVKHINTVFEIVRKAYPQVFFTLNAFNNDCDVVEIIVARAAVEYHYITKSGSLSEYLRTLLSAAERVSNNAPGDYKQQRLMWMYKVYK